MNITFLTHETIMKWLSLSECNFTVVLNQNCPMEVRDKIDPTWAKNVWSRDQRCNLSDKFSSCHPPEGLHNCCDRLASTTFKYVERRSSQENPCQPKSGSPKISTIFKFPWWKVKGLCTWMWWLLMLWLSICFDQHIYIYIKRLFHPYHLVPQSPITHPKMKTITNSPLDVEGSVCMVTFIPLDVPPFSNIWFRDEAPASFMANVTWAYIPTEKWSLQKFLWSKAKFKLYDEEVHTVVRASRSELSSVLASSLYC